MSETRDAGRARRPFNLIEGLDLLARTPVVLAALLGDLPASWLHVNEGRDTWSPFDVLGHLIHGERTDWLPRVRTILEHGESRPFAPFDRFAQQRESANRTVTELLVTFADLRRDNIEAVRQLKLTDGDLERRGMHPAFGSVTMRQLLSTWVAHDLDHVMQITRVLGGQFADEVGPWRAYLRVISGTQG